MEMFRKCRFADVGKSELGKKETCAKHKIDRSQNGRSNKVDVLHIRLTELHATHRNLPPAIRTLCVKETIQNIQQKRTKSDNCGLYIGVVGSLRCVVYDMNSSI